MVSRSVHQLGSGFELAACNGAMIVVSVANRHEQHLRIGYSTVPAAP